MTKPTTLYVYGHYGPEGILWAENVQIELVSTSNEVSTEPVTADFVGEINSISDLSFEHDVTLFGAELYTNLGDFSLINSQKRTYFNNGYYDILMDERGNHMAMDLFEFYQNYFGSNASDMIDELEWDWTYTEENGLGFSDTTKTSVDLNSINLSYSNTLGNFDIYIENEWNTYNKLLSSVEFIYDETSGDYYFLEVNTRLQVEHPVSELVSGIDLVREQICVAAGESLSFTQDDVECNGHAIEVRINAEDPAGGRFLPSPGTISSLRLPQGFGIRWDGGYEAGDVVSQFYDNLVGKLIVWGSDRPTAIERMRSALVELEVGGIATTTNAHKAILASPDFRAGEHSTKWVEDSLDLAEVSGKSGAAAESTGDEDPSVRKDVVLEVNGKRFEVAAWVPKSAGVAVNQKPTKVRRSASRDSGAKAGSGHVTVPMQGTIVKVLVQAGQEVSEGDAGVVLEAMKMENNINADKSGTVSEVKVAAGDTVGAGDVVVVID